MSLLGLKVSFLDGVCTVTLEIQTGKSAEDSRDAVGAVMNGVEEIEYEEEMTLGFPRRLGTNNRP